MSFCPGKGALEIETEIDDHIHHILLSIRSEISVQNLTPGEYIVIF